MTISEIKQEVWVPEPIVKASERSHEVKLRSEMQRPTFAEVLLHCMAARKQKTD